MFNAIWILLIVIFDQASKYICKFYFEGAHDKVILDGLFSLTYLENKGAAFGIFQNKKFILVGLTALIIIGLIIYLYKVNVKGALKIALILIIGGAIGNLIDRVFLGYVIDFLHFYVADVFNWPVFNFADVSVVCGTILMAGVLLFSKDEKEK